MIIVCEKCSSGIEINPKTLSVEGTEVICSNCGHAFKIYKAVSSKNLKDNAYLSEKLASKKITSETQNNNLSNKQVLEKNSTDDFLNVLDSIVKTEPEQDLDFSLAKDDDIEDDPLFDESDAFTKLDDLDFLGSNKNDSFFNQKLSKKTILADDNSFTLPKKSANDLIDDENIDELELHDDIEKEFFLELDHNPFLSKKQPGKAFESKIETKALHKNDDYIDLGLDDNPLGSISDDLKASDDFELLDDEDENFDFIDNINLKANIDLDNDISHDDIDDDTNNEADEDLGNRRKKSRRSGGDKPNSNVGLFLISAILTTFLIVIIFIFINKPEPITTSGSAIFSGSPQSTQEQGLDDPTVAAPPLLNNDDSDLSGSKNLSFVYENGASGKAYGFIENKNVGRLLVITGKVVNNYPEKRNFIRIQSYLKGKNNTILAERKVYAGNVLSREELENFSMPEIVSRLNIKAGENSSNMGVEPGQALPFMIVFDNIPSDREEYSIEPYSSQGTL